ncbi:hypothetical protein BKA82DRAFT_4344446 [Pisolithus tinctorius]|nr:hypothetical protein BKA82DRAFT_4344446 [Pisolithus tinctorius]
MEWVNDRGEDVPPEEAWHWYGTGRAVLGRAVGKDRPTNATLRESMYGRQETLRMGLGVKRWRREKRRFFVRRDRALSEDNASWIERRFGTPPREGVPLEERRSEQDEDVPLAPFLPYGPTRSQFTAELTAPVRFCLFNTGRLTRREVWDVLKDHLAPEVMDGVIRVQTFLQPNGYPRTDFWLEARVAARIKQGLYLTAAQRRRGTRELNKFPLYKLKWFWKHDKLTARWRLDTWKSWRDRKLEPRPARPAFKETPRRGIATLNVNGMGAKKPGIINLLRWNRIGVLAIQETLLGKNQYRFHVEGYETYQRPKSTGFRGHALLVSRRFPSYEVSPNKEKCYIHVKITKLSGDRPWHVISVYLPSGGNRRSERTRCLKDIMLEYRDVISKDRDAKVVIMGDFNMRRDELARRIAKENDGPTCLKIAGCGLTFHRKGTKWSDVDNILVSPAANRLLKPGKVVRNWGADSDHFPIVTALKGAEKEPRKRAAPVTHRFNVDLVKGHGKAIVNHNRWSALPVDPIETEEDLDRCAEQFSAVVNDVALELGIKTQRVGAEPRLNRTLKKKADKAAKAHKKWELAAERGSATADRLWQRYCTLKKDTRKHLKAWKKKMHEKEVARVAKLYFDGEIKAFHRWEDSTTKGTMCNDGVKPVTDKEGRLLTDEADIRQRTYEYFKDLHQDDPRSLSRNKDYWAGKARKRREQELQGLNDTPAWREILLAIRQMTLGTAPGHDDIPIEVYKALLKEECHRSSWAYGKPRDNPNTGVL